MSHALSVVPGAKLHVFSEPLILKNVACMCSSPQGKLQIFSERSARCEQAEASALSAHEDAEAKTRELASARAELDVLKAEERARQGAERDGKERAELLAMDKTFLQRELDALREAHARIEDKCQRQGIKVKEAKR